MTVQGLCLNRLLLGAAIAVLCAAPAFAGATTVADTTLAIAYSGTNPTTYSATGFAGPTTGDYIGSDFNTDKLVVTVGVSSLELKYYTVFDGADLGAQYADIFMAPASGGGTVPAWSYGLALGSAAQNFQGGVATPGLYALAGGDGISYLTSLEIWGGRSGYTYGGGFIAPDGTQNASPTRVIGGNLMSGWSVATTVTHNSVEDAGFPNVVDVILTAPVGSTLDSIFDQNAIDIFWGTGDCSNDALFASVSVPEPASLSLFGAGVAGAMAAYGRRKKKKA